MSGERDNMINKVPSLITVSDLRKSLIKRVYQIGLVLLIPLLGFSIIYLWLSDLILAITVPIVMLCILGVGATKRFRPKSKAWILAGILCSIGIFNLFLYGWMSDGRVFLLASMLVASLLITKRAGYSFWGGGIVLTVGYLLITYIGWINPAQGRIVNVFALRVVLEWLVFVILGGGLVLTVGFWLTKIANAINEIKANREVLRDERSAIADQVQNIETIKKKIDKREAILDATASVAGSLAAVQPLHTMLTLTVNLFSEYFGFEHAGIYLMDESEKWMILRAASSEAGKNLLAQDFRLRVDETSIVGWVAANQQLKSFDFDKDDIRNQENDGFTPLRAELAIPILISGDLVGVLDLQSADPLAFDEYTVDSLQRLVSELALIYSTTRRLDSIPALEIVNPFYNAGQRIASAQTDSAVYASILEILCVFSPSRLTFIRKEDDSGELYTVFDSINGKSSFVRQSVKELDNPFLGMITQYGTDLFEPVWLEKNKLHIVELPEQLYEMMLNEQVNSVGVVPVVIDDQVNGVVISMFDVPHQVSQVEMRLHRLVAILAGLAIERNKLKAEIEIRSEQEYILDGVRNQLGSTLNPDLILRRTVRELGQLLGAEMAQVQVSVNDKDDASNV